MEGGRRKGGAVWGEMQGGRGRGGIVQESLAIKHAQASGVSTEFRGTSQAALKQAHLEAGAALTLSCWPSAC